MAVETQTIRVVAVAVFEVRDRDFNHNPNNPLISHQQVQQVQQVEVDNVHLQ